MTRATTPPSYSFHSAWTVAAERARVYDVLEDVEGYPSWWPQVRSVDRLDEHTASVVCRASLPYTLRLELRQRRRDRDGGVLEASLEGDLVGWCRWTLSSVGPATCPATGPATYVDFEQEVTTPSRWLRLLGGVVRPALVLNHQAMMRGARRGLDDTCAR